jgi:hypothetical protein
MPEKQPRAVEKKEPSLDKMASFQYDTQYHCAGNVLAGFFVQQYGFRVLGHHILANNAFPNC